MKLCANCNNEIAYKPHANNVKYCDACRPEMMKYKEYRSRWQREKADRIARENITGKLQCLICGKYYKKPVFHAYIRHGVTESEYKSSFGLDHKKGIITDSAREILQDHVKNNYDKVVVKNLLIKGKKSRFKKGDPTVGKYIRSEQTINRLKNQFKKHEN